MDASLDFAPEVGYSMSTHLAGDFFADDFDRRVPTSARLYVRRKDSADIHPVMGLRKDRVTGEISGETFDFQFIPLDDEDYLYAEVNEVKKWRVMVVYTLRRRTRTFSATVWTDIKDEAIEMVVESLMAVKPFAQIQTTYATKSHVKA